MKKKLIALMIMLAMVFCLAACGGGSEEAAEPEETETEAVEETEEAAETEAPADPSEVVVDTENKSVTISAQLNGTFFDQSTMHYCVNKDGKMGDKCMFAAYCSVEDFYNAMLEIGGEPWNTSSDKIANGEFTDGPKVDVTLTWEGQTEPVALVDTVKTDDGKLDVDMRFSGNMDNNNECGSGCIACLNSCWAGITSNASYGYNTIDSGEVNVYLDDSIMPEDGTMVQMTFTLQ